MTVPGFQNRLAPFQPEGSKTKDMAEQLSVASVLIVVWRIGSLSGSQEGAKTVSDLEVLMSGYA